VIDTAVQIGLDEFGAVGALDGGEGDGGHGGVFTPEPHQIKGRGPALLVVAGVPLAWT
jgi:hypothetical protein